MNIRKDWKEIAAYYEAGASYEDCFRKFNVCKRSMWLAAKRGDIKPRTPTQRALSAIDHMKKLHGNKGARDTIRKKIISEKILSYVCRICGIKNWRGKPLTLRLDHINGNNGDHRLENLGFICANCDSQQETYCYRNVKKQRAPSDNGSTSDLHSESRVSTTLGSTILAKL